MTRIALIDRPWLGYRSVMLATPLTAAPIERVRAVFAEFLRRHPEAPLSCRVDGTRWAPVDDVEAHLDRVLRPAPDPDDLEAHVAAHGVAPADLPFVATVSPTSAMINGAHVLGDAVTLAQLLLALATADPHAFAAIGDRARTADALRALARGLPGHGRGWLDHARHPVAPPAVRPVPTVVPPAPAFAGTVLDQGALRAITKWRNANARGVSLTGVLASLAHRALTAHGIPVAGDGLAAIADQTPTSPSGFAIGATKVFSYVRCRWGSMSTRAARRSTLRLPAQAPRTLRTWRRGRRGHRRGSDG